MSGAGAGQAVREDLISGLKIQRASFREEVHYFYLQRSFGVLNLQTNWLQAGLVKEKENI